MKFFICAIVISTLAIVSLAAPVDDDVIQAANTAIEEESNNGEENSRFKKAAPQPQTSSYQQVNTRSAYSGPASPPYSAPQQPTYSGPSASQTPYSMSYPAPLPSMPCAKNLILSCQPTISPVSCSAPAQPAPIYSGAPGPSQGYAGAYSEPVAQWVSPYGVPFAPATYGEVYYGY